LTYIDLIKADKDSIEKFGDDYKAYMKRVPRGNFLLDIIRLIRFRKWDYEFIVKRWKIMSLEKTNRQQWKPSRNEIVLYSLLGILFIGLIVLCFLFFNWMNIIWFVYIGVTFFVIGFFVFGGMARIAFLKKGGSTNDKKWLDTKKVVDSGIYAVVRHPIYISFMFYVIGLMFVSQHWLVLVFGIPIIIYFYQFMRIEEEANIKRFGDDYRQYMKKVPRANFLLGIIRMLRSKRKEI